MKVSDRHNSRDSIGLHLGLLIGWMALGIGLRFVNLTLKPLWTDEFSTLVFSLGNSFRTIPLNQVISVEQLLEPLQPRMQAGVSDVLHYLLTESNHPPLYFVLNHLWFQLFPMLTGASLVWAARSLAALWGVLTIPALFGFSWLAFRSMPIAHLSAALMAVSPFAVYLSQEARHYTLATFWIIGSLACLVLYLRANSSTARASTPSLRLVTLWVGINGLGMATHYFFLLTLAAEAIVVVGYIGLRFHRHKQIDRRYWVGLGIAAIGTLMGILVWLPWLNRVQENGLTQWLSREETGLGWIDPILQLMAALVSMLYLLPVQSHSTMVEILSAMGLVGLVLWTLPKLIRGWKIPDTQAHLQLMTQLVAGFVVGAIAVILSVTYLLQMDLPSSLRYNFVYFPGVIVLLATGLDWGWCQKGSRFPFPGWRTLSEHNRSTLALILIASLVGGLTVTNNLAYQKPHLPDEVAATIHETLEPSIPTLIAIAHDTHGQTGRMMGIAWELQHRLQVQSSVSYLLAADLLAAEQPDQQGALQRIRQIVMEQPRPFDLWLVNVPRPEDLDRADFFREENCVVRSRLHGTDGYKYQRYRCR